MNKPMRALMVSAALAGFLTGTAAMAKDQSGNSSSSDTGNKVLAKKNTGDKHACKGQNSCKGKGGCSSGDNGCKGKNSCKGKGGCATDGSKPPSGI